jgi:drug/metabolite transporter (DMT)-like permease
MAGGAIFGVRMVSYYKGIEIEGASVAAAFLLLSPVVSVLSANAFLSEPLTGSIIAGVTLAVAGGVLLARAKR